MGNDLHDDRLKAVGTFLSAYATHMMGCGVHTSRVVRCTQRIGESYGYTVVTMMVQKGVLIKLYDPKSNALFAIEGAIPPLPISFEHNARLSALSWEASQASPCSRSAGIARSRSVCAHPHRGRRRRWRRAHSCTRLAHPQRRGRCHALERVSAPVRCSTCPSGRASSPVR